MTPSYKKMLPGLLKILSLFDQHRLSYILFKCEHLFAGHNKNMDILLETTEQYHQAAKLLEQQGWALRFSEKFEKYKLMYCGFVTINGSKTFHSVHLHREIAWHGIKALDKKPVFERKNVLAPLIVVPSVEDSILIHAGHVLFENFQVTEREKKYFDRLTDLAEADLKYINAQISLNGWEQGFRQVTKQPLGPISFFLVLRTWLQKLARSPTTSLYITRKIVKKVARRIIHYLPWPHRGVVIALLGPNGSGKTILTRELYQEFQPLTSQFHGQKGYYFGWDPLLPTTRLFRKFQGSQGTYRRLNEKYSFSLFKEAAILYIFLEYLVRYYAHIYPSLRKGSLVITDRYYYDNYAQHAYAEKSALQRSLLHLFPQPDFAYILNAPVEILANRDKSTALFSTTVSRHQQRTVHPADDLENQIQRYALLQPKINAVFLSTENNLNANAQRIIEETWRKLVKT